MYELSSHQSDKMLATLYLVAFFIFEDERRDRYEHK